MIKQQLRLVINFTRAPQIKKSLKKFINRFWIKKSYDPSKVFNKIYANKRWGSLENESIGSSGIGSHDESLVQPYIELIKKLSITEPFSGLTFVDLGCGDFNIGKDIFNLSSKYIAIDVVQELIDRNKSVFSADQIEFRCLDIVRDPLPEGNVCFIRQVLQHLSNSQIKKVLQKLDAYEWVFITEHYPSIEMTKKHNIDKITGSDIRVGMGSGVYLTSPPFSLNPQSVQEVLEIPYNRKELIRTFLYKPNIQK